MKVDIIIRDGHVIDPSQNINRQMDIGVQNGMIVSAGPADEGIRSIDASGCYVTPGL
jgi:dihydroorotase